VIDPVVRIMMDSVHRYEGTVSQILGDGIMALFGAPLAHEDHALRACYAALTMQDEMRSYRQKPGQSELHVGVGLNSGEVVVRSVDNDLNIDYSAIGHTTNLAARMQELAGSDVVLISISTLRKVEGFVQVESLGPVQAKGISRPVEAYSLVGTTSARTRVQASLGRGLTPLVGRTTEIDIFNKLIQRANAGHGQILAMIGEPGMGKSRLVHEFTRHWLPPDWLVLGGTSVSYGKATPYFPLIEMLRRYFGIAARESSDKIRNQVVKKVLELDSTLKDTIPSILSLLGALLDDKTIPVDHQREWLPEMQDIGDMIKRFDSMDPQQRRRHILDALKRICIRESQRQSLLLVFEDLHWIDHETQAFLDGLVDNLRIARVMLLVNYRREYSHEWSDKSYYTQLRVDPLESSSAEELLSNLLGINPALEPLKQLLVKRTEGNPFFAEESVRSLVESGVLAGEKGAYQLALKIDDLVIPSTVQSVVADRIDHLPIDEKYLLQTAAVIGMIVPLGLLRAVAELPDEDFYRYLSHLQSAEFLYETNLFPELVYSFKHALTAEVTYGALLHKRKIYLHSNIVNALEKNAPDNLHDHLETLAHHALHGELWEKAAIYSRSAGAKALSQSANTLAVTCFNQALYALERIPESREKLERCVDVRLDLRNALFLTGEFERIRDCLAVAQRLAEILDDRSRLRRILNFWLSFFSLLGEPARVIELGERASGTEITCDESSADMVTKYYLGINYYMMGSYQRARHLFKSLIAALDRDKMNHERFGTSVVLAVSCRYWLVQTLAQIGLFGEGLSSANEGMKIAEQANHPYSHAYMICNLGFLLLLKGDLNDAIVALEHSMKICQEADIRALFPQIASYLGFAYALAGQERQSLELLEEADSASVSIGRLAERSLRVAWHGESYRLFGRIEEATRLASVAVELSKKHTERGHSAWAFKLEGALAAHREPPDFQEAERCYNAALTLAGELEMSPLAGHCRLGLGQLYLKMCDRARACTELSNAIEIYRSMDMSFWLSQAQSHLSNLNH
ncbi:MAG TPA: AAA family ATPase, partial [Candidatus Binatia bacterium]|nr:AAA family ATPase [Candidatus Binatia bacterium]